MLEESKGYPLDTNVKIRIIGVEAQMSTLYFLFGISLGVLILTLSDNLSKTLQHQFISASEGQHVARLILDVVKSICQLENFYLLYQRVLVDQKRFDVSMPNFSTAASSTKRFQTGNTNDCHHSSPEE